MSRVSLSVQGRAQDVVVNQSGPFHTMLDLTGVQQGSVDIRCLADGRDGSSETDNAYFRVALQRWPGGLFQRAWPFSPSTNSMNRTATARFGAPRNRLIGSQLTLEPPSGVTYPMRPGPLTCAWNRA